MAGTILILDGGVSGLLAAAATSDPARTTVLIAPDQPDPALLQRSAAEKQAALYGLGLAPELVAPSSGPADSDGVCRMLMEACFLARKRGAEAVIWPIGAGLVLDLDAATAAADRALLVGRLASIGEEHPIEVRVPFVDFTDRQLADLVLDMDLPIWTCWWYGSSGGAVAERERQRWGALLREAGWRGSLPGPEMGVRVGRGVAKAPGLSSGGPDGR